MKIIVVRGKKNVGKTTSIQMAYDELKKNNPSAKFARVQGPKVPRSDILVAVEVNGVTIVFASAGDIAEEVKDMLKAIRNTNWDILICATRTRGETVTLIENYIPNIPIIWIEKNPFPSNPEAANKATSREILNHI